MLPCFLAPGRWCLSVLRQIPSQPQGPTAVHHYCNLSMRYCVMYRGCLCTHALRTHSFSLFSHFPFRDRLPRPLFSALINKLPRGFIIQSHYNYNIGAVTRHPHPAELYLPFDFMRSSLSINPEWPWTCIAAKVVSTQSPKCWYCWCVQPFLVLFSNI